jgi:hypothetical protein
VQEIQLDEDWALAPNAGAAYVFTRSDQAWSQQAYLKASTPGRDDGFGGAVAVYGDTIVVGAQQEDGDGSSEADDNTPNAGAAYVFVRSGESWSQPAYLKANYPQEDDFFGASVAICGDTVVVGVLQLGINPVNLPGDTAPEAGAAYVFAREGTAWEQQGYLKASNADSGDRFGWSVAVTGDSVLEGAPAEDGDGSDLNNNSATGAGAAYVFTRSGAGWSQPAYLKASIAEESDQFGYSVALSGITAVCGARYEDGDGIDEDANSATLSGAAFVFMERILPLAIRLVEVVPSGLKLVVPMIPDDPVGVEYSPDMSPGSWIDLGNFFFFCGQLAFIDQDSARASQPSGFYRAFMRPVEP